MATQTDAAPQPAPARPSPNGQPPGAASGRRRDTAAWLVPLLLVVVAATVRFVDLGHPDRIYFDETYYAVDAAQLLERGVEEGFVVHPPVGKWVIAAGIAILGDTPVGWRAPVALAGTLTVLACYAAGLRLFRRRGVAALAGLLLALDGLALTMSRIAMLDAILTLFVVSGFVCLLVDRDQQWRALPEAGDRPEPPPRPHRYRWLAGLCFGLALATKWSALLAIGAAGLFVLASELAYRRRTTGRALAGWPRAAASALLTLVAVPAVVYVASYTLWFANFELTRPAEEHCPEPQDCSVALPTMAAEWLSEQVEIAEFHADLDADHPYRASPVGWPVMWRPVAYYYESCSDERRAELAEEGEECEVEPGVVAHILGIGNPGVWWPALALAYPALAWFGFVRRDWRALAISAFLAVQYLPWLLANRPAFLFYVTPIVPFIALSLAYLSWRSMDHALLRWVPAAIAVVAVAGFVFWYPVWVGLELPDDAWNLRMWSRKWI